MTISSLQTLAINALKMFAEHHIRISEADKGALSKKEKTVILVTHQVDFLPAFDSILLMLDRKPCFSLK